MLKYMEDSFTLWPSTQDTLTFQYYKTLLSNSHSCTKEVDNFWELKDNWAYKASFHQSFNQHSQHTNWFLPHYVQSGLVLNGTLDEVLRLGLKYNNNTLGSLSISDQYRVGLFSPLMIILMQHELKGHRKVFLHIHAIPSFLSEDASNIWLVLQVPSYISLDTMHKLGPCCSPKEPVLILSKKWR